MNSILIDQWIEMNDEESKREITLYSPVVATRRSIDNVATCFAYKGE